MALIHSASCLSLRKGCKEPKAGDSSEKSRRVPCRLRRLASRKAGSGESRGSQKRRRCGLAPCRIAPSHRRGFLRTEESVEGKTSAATATSAPTAEGVLPPSQAGSPAERGSAEGPAAGAAATFFFTGASWLEAAGRVAWASFVSVPGAHARGCGTTPSL